ncbi:MAG: hypothetical protein PWP23_2258 [Candidatus Sumerlaeota bacterium]|nr:hypothetical protein [Candidatus Sumerlaeota bacterium]
MVGIVLEGEQAEEERNRLLQEGREIPVGVRIRNARGKETALWLGLGLSGSSAWLFCREERVGEASKVSLEGVLAHEAQAFFAALLEGLHLRQCLVDPGPLSPEIVEISPCIDNVLDDLRAEFGIELNLQE